MSLISEEINPIDKKSLEGSGEKIIETVEIGPYTAILVRNKMGRYQIGLTSHERSFTTKISQYQVKKTLKPSCLCGHHWWTR
jgi:hypothetical protein